MQQRCELQELELQKSAKKTKEAMALAADDSAKTKAAKEVIKSLTAQVLIQTLIPTPLHDLGFHFIEISAFIFGSTSLWKFCRLL